MNMHFDTVSAMCFFVEEITQNQCFSSIHLLLFLLPLSCVTSYLLKICVFCLPSAVGRRSGERRTRALGLSRGGRGRRTQQRRVQVSEPEPGGHRHAGMSAVFTLIVAVIANELIVSHIQFLYFM
jgi:hypothetical protein